MKSKLLLLAIFLPLFSLAARTWVGPSVITLAAWNDPANWSSTGVPGTSESVTFNSAVTFTENVPITSDNDITIITGGSVTISSTAVLDAHDVLINGGTLTNNGTINAHNVAYGNAGGTINNPGTFNANNLNVGNASNAGTFNNSGPLNITMNIVAEEGILNNQVGGTVTTTGITIQNGAKISNSGTINNGGPRGSAQMNINAGGEFENLAGSVLNVDLYISNVYAIRNGGIFTNAGSVNIGHTPYNSGAEGILNENTGVFNNTGKLSFWIDPLKCVLVNNNNAAGSLNVKRVYIYSGNNCLNTTLPITLKTFAGTNANGLNVISWTMTNELQISNYQLECSNSGAINSWETIGTVSAINDQKPENIYQYADKHAPSLSYYRLKIITASMDFNYSKTIVLNNLQSNIASISLWPNPATELLSIAGLNNSQTYTFKVIDNNGVNVLQSKQIFNSIYKMDVRTLKSGSYHLLVFDEQGKTAGSLPFIKTK